MKKINLIILIVCLVQILTGCNNKENTNEGHLNYSKGFNHPTGIQLWVYDKNDNGWALTNQFYENDKIHKVWETIQHSKENKTFRIPINTFQPRFCISFDLEKMKELPNGNYTASNMKCFDINTSEKHVILTEANPFNLGENTTLSEVQNDITNRQFELTNISPEKIKKLLWK